MAESVRVWLASLGLEKYAEAFAENEIDSDVLPHLSEDDLRELGLPLGPRKKIMAALANLGGVESTGDNGNLISRDAERRQLTVMFVDLVESSVLAGRLDPEDLREVIAAYQTTSAEAISRYDGYVAKYIGDGLLVYFGYPQAHEDDAQRAVNAGLGIVENLAVLSRQVAETHGSELGVRIGIHTGLVVAGEMGEGGAKEEAAIVGETPNIAARLQSLAAPNTVAISDSTHSLVEGLFECCELGPQELKGISRKVDVYSVKGQSAAPSRFEAAAERGLAHMIGREEEIDLLLKRWEQAKDGEGQLVLLSGEAGVGKSRIVRAFRDRLEAEAHNRILYFCSPYHTNSAFYPAVDQLGRALRFEKEDTANLKADKLMGVLLSLELPTDEMAPALASLLSIQLGDRISAPAPAPDELKRKILSALVRLPEAMSAQSPVLMIVEDAHWIDPSTLEYLSLLVERLSTARVFLLVTFRPEFDAPWAKRAVATSLALNRLSRKESAALALDVTGGKPLPEEVLAQIVAKTDGVPLFVEELTKTVLDLGLVEDRGDHFDLAAPIPALAIPTSLQDSLMARLDRLEPVKEIAQLAATIGRSFSRRLLSAVSPVDPASLDAAIAQLVDAELIYQRSAAPDATYEFKHALVRDAAYQSLLRKTRQDHHQRIAEALAKDLGESAQNRPEVIAHHFTEAGSTEPAIKYWEEAGRRAVDGSADVEAVAHFNKALELLANLPTSPDLARQELAIRVALGPALMMTRGVAGTEVERNYARARELAESVGDTAQQFASMWGHYYVFEIRARWREALDNVAEILEFSDVHGDSGIKLQAHHAAWTAMTFSGDLQAAQDHCETGCALYHVEEHGDHRFLYGGHDPGVCARVVGASAVSLLGYPQRAIGWLDEAGALARDLAHPSTEMMYLFFNALNRWALRDVDAAAKSAEQAVRLAERHSNTPFAKMGTILLGRTMSAQGRHKEGLDTIIGVLGPARQKRRGAFLISCYLGLLAEAYAENGRYDEGMVALDDAFLAVEDQNERFWEAELHRLRGDLLLSLSHERYEEAEASYLRAIGLARERDARLHELRAATSLAKLWNDSDRRSEASEMLSPVFRWYTEGFSLPDLKDAEELLSAL